MDYSPIYSSPELGQCPLINSNQDFYHGAKATLPSGSDDYASFQNFDFELNGFDNEDLNLNNIDNIFLPDMSDNLLDNVMTDIPINDVEQDYQLSSNMVSKFSPNYDLQGSPSYDFGTNTNTNIDEFNPYGDFSFLPSILPDEIDEVLNPVKKSPEQTIPLVSNNSNFTIKLKKFKAGPKKQASKKSKESNLQQVPDPVMTADMALQMENTRLVLEKIMQEDSDSDSNCSVELGPSAPVSPWNGENFTIQPEVSSLREQNFDESREPKTKKKKTSFNDRVERKKEQNKQAALRYRMKKRQAEDGLHKLMIEEEKKQVELKNQLKKLKQEAKFMKKLMREAFIIKGLVSADAFKSSSMNIMGNAGLAP